MDNFMDKLAQRLNAQEMIRANSQAEAQELSKVREQLHSYDECLQEMRRLNLKNAEAADRVKLLAGQVNDLAGQAIQTIKESGGRDQERLDAALEKLRTALDELQALDGKRKETEDAARKEREQRERQLLTETRSQLEEFVHKECVKVYRNVQAVLLEESKSRTEELTRALVESRKAAKGRTALLVAAAVSGFGSLALLVMELLQRVGIFPL